MLRVRYGQRTLLRHGRRQHQTTSHVEGHPTHLLPKVATGAVPDLFKVDRHQLPSLQYYSFSTTSSKTTIGCDVSQLILPSHDFIHYGGNRTTRTDHPFLQHRRLYHSHNGQQVFVSRHNDMINVTSSHILDFCRAHGVDVSSARSTMRNVTLEECPFCPKPTRGRLDNQFKLNVKIGDGAYNCFRCGAKGSWFDFKARIGGHQVTTQFNHGGSGGVGGGGFGGGAVSGGTSGGYGGRDLGNTGSEHLPYASRSTQGSDGFHSSLDGHNPCLPMPTPRLSGVYNTKLLDCTDDHDENKALDYLVNVRKLNRTTLRKFGVGRATYQFAVDRTYKKMECITFPWIMRESDVEFQESLRGAKYVASGKDEVTSSVTTNDTGAGDDDVSSVHKEDEGEDNEDKLSSPKGKFVTRRFKVRAVEEKAHQRLDPPGGGWGLFGYHTVPADAKEVVITEGEFDAMAVWQGTGRPAMSLPNGCRSLPLEVLPLLERFEKIYLWMDSDGPGQEGAEKFARKLGLKRCFLVKSNVAKDANDALRAGIDMNELIASASVTAHARVLQFSHLKNDVLHELLNPDEYKGVPIPSLPGLTKIVKGFRRGEMTVLTGPTGSGKTTFLSQMSLDLAEQGVNCLWGSFEIKNTRLLQKLLQQFGRKALPKSSDLDAKEVLEALASQFEQLPMYFLKFHGGSQIDDVLDAMEYAVYVNDVEHIILDNMQFMITRSDLNSRSSFDKFDVQDVAIEKFRKFATDNNVHVTLVVHPRKEDDSMKLNIASFYGSAKATQEADTVLILQKEDRRKYIDVKKNRYDGQLGISPIYFDRESGRYTEDERGHLADSNSQKDHKLKPKNLRSADEKFDDSKKEEKEADEKDKIADHWARLFD